MSKVSDFISGILNSRENTEKVKLQQIPEGEVLTENTGKFLSMGIYRPENYSQFVVESAKGILSATINKNITEKALDIFFGDRLNNARPCTKQIVSDYVASRLDYAGVDKEGKYPFGILMSNKGTEIRFVGETSSVTVDIRDNNITLFHANHDVEWEDTEEIIANTGKEVRELGNMVSIIDNPQDPFVRVVESSMQGQTVTNLEGNSGVFTLTGEALLKTINEQGEESLIEKDELDGVKIDYSVASEGNVTISESARKVISSFENRFSATREDLETVAIEQDDVSSFVEQGQ